ncbi:MAG TPA: EamA family transporter [Anaerolineae bacterium]|nr:EamA family transporter [Anaerolineae bacterium]
MKSIKDRSIPGITLVIIAAGLWGTVTVGVKILYDLGETTPLTVSWLRLTVAAPALYLLGFHFTGEHPFRVFAASQGGRMMLLLAALAMAAYQILLFAALTRTTVTTGVVLTICSAPIFAAVLAWPFLDERPTVWVGVSMAGAIIGTILLSKLTEWQALAQGDYLWGNLLAIGAGLSYASYSLLARKLVGRLNPWHIIAITFGGGSLLMLPLVLAQGFVAQFNGLGWGVVFYLGLIPTALAYVFYIFGLRTTMASVATTVSLIEPLTASLLAFLMLGERLTPGEGVGAMILLAAMVLLYQRR